MAEGGAAGPTVQRRVQTVVYQQLPILYKWVHSARKGAIRGPQTPPRLSVGIGAIDRQPSGVKPRPAKGGRGRCQISHLRRNDELSEINGSIERTADSEPRSSDLTLGLSIGVEK